MYDIKLNVDKSELRICNLVKVGLRYLGVVTCVTSCRP